jgi:zinc protease
MNDCSIYASGNIDQDVMNRTMMVFMGVRPRGPEDKSELPQTPAPGKTKIYLVNKEGAPQSEIRVGYLGMPYDATGEFYRASVMNYILGGAFNSRLNLNLRENKGYTYGIRSGFSGSHIAGPWTVATGVRGNATDSAVGEIIKEIKLYREKGIKKDELKFTKSSMLEREALKYETNREKAGYLERQKEFNLPDDYLKQQATILGGMKNKEINALAQKHLPIDNMVIVVVGDAKSVKPGLQKLGYEVEDMDMSVLGFKN